VALKEVPKLAKYTAQLHVCITYVKDDDFPGDDYAVRTKDILEEMSFEGEFLLVLGTGSMNSPTDWACHQPNVRKRLEVTSLLLPSSVELLPTGEADGMEERAHRHPLLNSASHTVKIV